jgi:hypothetical protein
LKSGLIFKALISSLQFFLDKKIFFFGSFVRNEFYKTISNHLIYI